jgi:hypothetical protein
LLSLAVGEEKSRISIETREMAEEAAATGSSVVGRAVEEVRSALSEHADVVAELFGRVSSELRTGYAPAVDSFIGFFHAIDWKVPPTYSHIHLSSIMRAWI